MLQQPAVAHLFWLQATSMLFCIFYSINIMALLRLIGAALGLNRVNSRKQ